MQEEVARDKKIPNAGKVRPDGKVLPQEPVDIYATKSKAGKHLGEVGTKHTVHAVLADKLVKKGAATLEAPAPKKEVKLTKAEIKDLAATLGHEPSDDEIAEAVAKKGEDE